MSFLNKNDFKTLIKSNVLDEVTETDDTLIETASHIAQKEMNGYLRSKFNVGVIFAATGSNRDELLVTYAIDIALYHLHARINPRFIPDIRIERYKNAITWLKDVAKGDIAPDLPPIPPTDENGNTTSEYRFGSIPKFNSDY